MKEINQYNLKEMTKGNVIIEFYTPWCNPCSQLTSTLTKLSKEFSHISFLKINAEENNEASLLASIRSVPTILFLKDGKELNRLIGYRDYNFLKQTINESYTCS